MLNNKPVSANKHDPAGPVRTIVSKSVANLRSIPIRQKLSMTNSHDRLRQIAVATYRVAQRSFEDGYEVTGLVRGRN
jgi:hypothetical protein